MIINAISNTDTSFNGLGNKVTAKYKSDMRNISRKIIKAVNDKNLKGERRDIFVKSEYKKEMKQLREQQIRSAGQASTLFD